MRWIASILLLSLIPSGSNWKLWLHYCCGELEEVQLFEKSAEPADDCCDFLCLNNCCDQLLLEIPAMLDNARSDYNEVSLKKLIDTKIPMAIKDELSVSEKVHRAQEKISFKTLHPPPVSGALKRLSNCSLVFYG